MRLRVNLCSQRAWFLGSAAPEMHSEEFDNNNAQYIPSCGTVREEINRSTHAIRGAHVKKLRKRPDKSLEPKGVPEDFEPQVIDETDESGCTIIAPLDHRRGLKSPTNRKTPKKLITKSGRYSWKLC
jgi:hypothetical protein